MTVIAPGLTENEALQQAEVPGITRPMTYEEYLAGPEEMARYDIIDGWKVYRLYGDKQLANPTRVHQQIQGNLYVAFRAYAQAQQRGKAILAPCDVRVKKRALRSRQPDLLFISQERLAENPPSDDPAPLDPAPELVVEIVSPSDRPSVLAAKIADYRSVDVQEVWVVRSSERRVEIIRLSAEEIETVGVYEVGQVAVSHAFPGLEVAVQSLFDEE
jgi:Uma2 family endonuclease